MKVKTLSALAGLSGVMIASSANAAFTGVSLVSSDAYFSAHPNAGVQTAWNGGPSSVLDIYRLYANFNSNTAADRVNAVAGIPGSPFTVSVIGGTFFNVVDGHGIHANLASGVSPPVNSWDTYVTINSLPSSALVSLSPGFDAATNNLGAATNLIPASTNVAWFITPDNTAGQAAATAVGQENAPAGTFRVLLAQFTVTSGGLLAGTASLNVNGVDMPIAFTNVPAPGALALLGLAGLVCRRRRA